MTRKLIVLSSVFAMLCLIAAPAMANLIVSIQPTAITAGPDTGMNVTGLTNLSVQTGDVIAFQIVGNISPTTGDCGVTFVAGSLSQILGSGGVWTTKIYGAFSAVTLAPSYNAGASHSTGVGGVDIGNDGFALDIGSTWASGAGGSNYIIPSFNAVGHGANGDVLGTFSYTVTDANDVNTTPTNLSWVARTAGVATGKASWVEAGTTHSPGTGFTYTAGPTISLTVAVPEPATLILISMCGLALLLFRRRK